MGKVVIVSIALEGYDILFRKCINSQKEYSKHFNYDYFLIDKLDISLKPEESSWVKISLIKNLLNRYESVLFLDCDCYIKKNSPPIVELINKYNKSIYMAKGFSGRFNAGVMYFRSDNISKSFLEDVRSYADTPVPQECKAPYENGHIIFISKKYLEHIHTLETELWNNNIQLSDNSYIVHFSGGKLRPYYMQSEISLYTKFYYKLFKKINRGLKTKIKFSTKFELLEYAENVIFVKYK